MRGVAVAYWRTVSGSGNALVCRSPLALVRATHVTCLVRERTSGAESYLRPPLPAPSKALALRSMSRPCAAKNLKANSAAHFSPSHERTIPERPGGDRADDRIVVQPPARHHIARETATIDPARTGPATG